MKRTFGTIGAELKRIFAETKLCLAKPGEYGHPVDMILLECRHDGIFFVTTNGTRIALSKFNAYPDGQTGQYLVAPKELELVLGKVKAKTPVLIHLNGSVSIETEEFHETLTLPPGKFPRYENIIPKPHTSVVFGYDDLLGLVQSGISSCVIPDSHKPWIFGKFWIDNGVATLDVLRIKPGPRFTVEYISEHDVEVQNAGACVVRSRKAVRDQTFYLDLATLKRMLTAFKGSREIAIQLPAGERLPVLITGNASQTTYCLAPIQAGRFK